MLYPFLPRTASVLALTSPSKSKKKIPCFNWNKNIPYIHDPCIYGHFYKFYKGKHAAYHYTNKQRQIDEKWLCSGVSFIKKSLPPIRQNTTVEFELFNPQGPILNKLLSPLRPTAWARFLADYPYLARITSGIAMYRARISLVDKPIKGP